MKKAIEYSPSEKKLAPALVQNAVDGNIRECPSCGYLSLFGMPGGRDAICKYCGYKDPCCYD